MEKFLYESRPVFYIAVATWAFANKGDSQLGAISAAMLLFCGMYVMQMRYVYRNRADNVEFDYNKKDKSR